jgi:hypothetical protein
MRHRRENQWCNGDSDTNTALEPHNGILDVSARLNGHTLGTLSDVAIFFLAPGEGAHIGKARFLDIRSTKFHLSAEWRTHASKD